MPGIPAAVIAAIIGAATSAVTGGLQLSEAFTPSMPKPPNPNVPTPQQSMAQKASASAEAPNIQAASGGSLSPEYWAQILPLLSGTANQPGSAQSAQTVAQNFFGPGQPGLSNPGSITGGGLTSGSQNSPVATGAGTNYSLVSSGIDELFDKFGGSGKGLTG